MKVKVVYGSDIRRWRYPSTDKYRSLLSFIQETFGFNHPSDFYLQFEDDEGDHLTMSSESDFEDAFSCAEHESRRSLKIFVVKGPIESQHISSSIDFDLISNPSESDNMSAPLTEEKLQSADADTEFEPEPEPEPDCRRLMIDFLTDEKIKSLLPDLARDLMVRLRAEAAKERDNIGEDEDSGAEPPKEIEEILREILQNEKYLPIIAHELYHNRIADMLPCICSKMQCYRHVLLTFNEDAVASWVPHAINVLTTAVTNFEKVDFDVEMDPMCHTFFPTWFAFMDQHGGDSNGSNGEAIHRNVACDGCNADPIRGTRYKCCVCTNFDLCGNCESFGKHDAGHPMLKFNQPCWPGQHLMGLHEFMHMMMRGAGHPPPPPHHGRWWGPPPHAFGGAPPHQPPFGGGGRFCRRNRGGGHGRRRGHCHGDNYHHHHNHQQQHGNNSNHPFFSPHYRHSGRSKQDDNVSVASSSVSVSTQSTSSKANFPKAEFVEDVNIPDRSYYPVDTIMRKSWRMKNNGDVEWGDDVQLVFFKGNECLALEKRFSVLNAKPDEEVLVSAMIRTPKKPGRYCAYYRLAKNGDHFGPRVWVDIFAVEEAEVVAKMEQDAYRRAVKESKSEAKRAKSEVKRVKSEVKRVNKKEKLEKKAAKMSAKLEKVEQKLAELRQTPPPPKELEDEPMMVPSGAIAQPNAPAEVDAQLERLVEAGKVLGDEPPPPPQLSDPQPLPEPEPEPEPVVAVAVEAVAAPAEEKDDVVAQVLQASKEKEREEQEGDSAMLMAQSRHSHSLHISCMCGAPLIETTPVEAYYSGATVNCDICGKYCPSSAPIYHCPAEKTKDHPSGYDLCHQCVQFQMKSFVKKQLEQVANNNNPQLQVIEEPAVPPAAEEEPVVHPPPPQVEPPKPPQEPVLPVPDDVEEPPQPADVVVIPPPDEDQVAPVVDLFADFPFAQQAKKMMDMGFNEIEKIKFLLMKHKGNVERAVQQLLQ